MDRRGPRFVIEIGVLVTAAGLLGATLIATPWQLYATLGLLVGIGANCMSYSVHSQFLPNWFVRQPRARDRHRLLGRRRRRDPDPAVAAGDDPARRLAQRLLEARA